MQDKTTTEINYFTSKIITNEFTESVRRCFFFYILGEDQGASMLRHSLKEDYRLRNSALIELNNLEAVLSTDNPHHIDALLEFSERWRNANYTAELNTKDKLLSYGSYLFRLVNPSLNELKFWNYKLFQHTSLNQHHIKNDTYPQ